MEILEMFEIKSKCLKQYEEHDEDPAWFPDCDSCPLFNDVELGVEVAGGSVVAVDFSFSPCLIFGEIAQAIEEREGAKEHGPTT